MSEGDDFITVPLIGGLCGYPFGNSEITTPAGAITVTLVNSLGRRERFVRTPSRLLGAERRPFRFVEELQ